MKKKEKKEKTTVNHSALMIDSLNAYKWIKFAQCLVLIVMGILFISMCKASHLTTFITLGFWAVLLIYAVLEIFSAIVIKKSILSTEIFVSLIIFSISLMAICNSELQKYYILTWFFGILTAGYALILIASGVISLTIFSNDEKYGTKKWKRVSVAVIQFVSSGFLIALDICLWIFGPKSVEANDNNVMLVPIIIGVALLFMGFASMFYAFQASSTENILKRQNETRVDRKEETDSKDIETVDVTKKEDDSNVVTVDVDVSNTEESKPLLDNKSKKQLKAKKEENKE